MSRELEMSMTENMGPVAVLALNPAVDISYEIPQLLADQKVRAAKTYYHPGGNGINVARALAVLGVQVHCCSLIGGKGGVGRTTIAAAPSVIGEQSNRWSGSATIVDARTSSTEILRWYCAWGLRRPFAWFFAATAASCSMVVPYRCM